MQLPIILCLFIASVASERNCFRYSEDTLYCSEVQLKENEYVDFNSPLRGLHVVRSSGSIGVKTFSQLQLKVLKIEDSNITTIEDGALCSSPDLEKLTILRNTNFPSFTKNLFETCDNIKDLVIGGGTLESTAFEHLPNLEHLCLADFSLPYFSEEFLQPLKQLQLLEFLHCKFGEIAGGSICHSPNLSYFSMIGNSFPSTLPKTIFENCNHVEVFHFRYQDGKSEIEEDIFNDFVNLKDLVIDNLNIGRLTQGHLRGLDNVEDLEVEDSNIETIDEDALQRLGKLRKLSLSNNNISSIGPQVFTSLTNLVTLELDSNAISEVDPASFSFLVNLDTLELSYNKITSINHIKNPTLESLNIDSNLISTIDAVAVKVNLPNLKYLSVIGNNISEEYGSELTRKLEGVKVFLKPIPIPRKPIIRIETP